MFNLILWEYEESCVPKAMNYKTSSVIYFAGDKSEKIYILKAGRVVIKSYDIETGQEISDLIQTGEFFGVKSAMGRYPREEDAMVMADAQVIVFSVPEFEALASQNTRIILKMLRVFSNQLRRIHGKVSNLLSNRDQVNPEEGLFGIAVYYLKKKLYPEAIYALRKHLKYYPNGMYSTEANKYLHQAEQYAQQYGRGHGPALMIGDAKRKSPGAPGHGPNLGQRNKPTLSGDDKAYYDAMSAMGNQEYKEALNLFGTIIAQGDSNSHFADALFESGRCQAKLSQLNESVSTLSKFIKAFPQHEQVGEALFTIGNGYENSGDGAKAKGFYQKILSIPTSDGVRRKAKRALEAL